MTLYLDTSAAVKLLVEEPESGALAAHLDDLEESTTTFSSTLLETELRRVAVRLAIPQASASEVLSRVSLVEPNRSLFREAGLLPGDTLRSLDALHLATALRLDSPVVVAYDTRLLAAAHELGLDTLSPS